MTDTATTKPAPQPMLKALLTAYSFELEFKVSQGADENGPTTFVSLPGYDALPLVARTGERVVIEIVGGEPAAVTVMRLPPEGA